MFITSVPTASPSVSPSSAPTTLVPTSPPSITGLVVTLDVSMVVTEGLSVDDLSAITDSVISSYSVSEADVEAEVVYTTSGTLELQLPADVSEGEIVTAVTESLAEALGVHPRDVVVVSVDAVTGEVVYEVVSSTFADASDIQENLGVLSTATLEASLTELLPGIEVVSNEVSSDVTVDVNVVVNAADASPLGAANTDVSEALAELGFTVTSTVSIVTPAPSVSPTFTTLIPSSTPSMTGLVVTLSLSQEDGSMSSEELQQFTADLAEQYGVSVEDVQVEATYTVSGTMDVVVPEGVSLSVLAEELEASISSALGIHPRDIDVVIDPTTGEVSYTVTLADPTEAEDLQATLVEPSFLSLVTEELSSSIPDAIVTSVETDSDIVFDLVVTIDATASSVDLAETNVSVEEEFSNAGFSVETERNIPVSEFCSKSRLLPLNLLRSPSLLLLLVYLLQHHL